MKISIGQISKYQEQAEYMCNELLGIDPHSTYQDDSGYFQPVWMKYARKIAEHAMIAASLLKFEATESKP